MQLVKNILRFTLGFFIGGLLAMTLCHAASTDTINEARSKLVELHITRAPEVVREMNKTNQPRVEKLSEHAICSGAFVTAQGDILTARHCTEGAKEIVVVPEEGGEYKAVIIAQSPTHDLAFIHIDTFHASHFTLARRVDVGETVYVIGSPLGITASLSTGIISRFDGDLTYIDCSVLPGNSGGPAFNERGELVGIVTAGFVVLYGMTHLNIMQSIEAVYGFAKSLH